MRLSVLFPRLPKGALVTFRSLAIIRWEHDLVLWAFWSLVLVGTAFEAFSLEPELRLGAV